MSLLEDASSTLWDKRYNSSQLIWLFYTKRFVLSRQFSTMEGKQFQSVQSVFFRNIQICFLTTLEMPKHETFCSLCMEANFCQKKEKK